VGYKGYKLKKIISITLSFLIFQELYVSENNIEKDIPKKIIVASNQESIFLDKALNKNKVVLPKITDLISEDKSIDDLFNNLEVSKSILSINSSTDNSSNDKNIISTVSTLNNKKCFQVNEKSSIKNKQTLVIQTKTLFERILEDKKIPSGATSKEVREILYEKIKSSSQKIENELLFKAGKPRVLFGKNIAIVIDHIVNIVPEITASGEITLQGGHTYKTIASFKRDGGLSQNIFFKDPKTNCWLFDGTDNFTGKRFFKTIFPQGWTPEDVYLAITTGTLLDNQESETVQDRQVMRVKIFHKNNPEFIARLILYKRQNSQTWEIMTAFPEFNS